MLGERIASQSEVISAIVSGYSPCCGVLGRRTRLLLRGGCVAAAAGPVRGGGGRAEAAEAAAAAVPALPLQLHASDQLVVVLQRLIQPHGRLTQLDRQRRIRLLLPLLVLLLGHSPRELAWRAHDPR